MAITLIQTPNIIQTVYNPIYFVVSSTNVAQPNFNYVFNLYTGATATGNPIATINLLPRPNNQAIFNPARILESYVGTDFSIQTITGVTASQNNFVEYNVDFGEAYTGSTFTGLTNSGAIGAINGVLQYKEIPSWSYTTYLVNNGVTSTTVNFLTNQPRQGVYVNVLGSGIGSDFHLDIGTISYLTIANFQPSYARYTVTYDNIPVQQYDLAISSSTPSFIYHIPAGPANIDSAFMFPIIQTDALSYTIQLLNAAKHPISEAITYIVDQRCSKYVPVRIQFLNSLGGWDYVNFNLVSKTTLNLNRTTFKKNLPYNYAVGTRETTIIDMNGTYNYEINSDWVSDAYSIWFQELFTSQQINIILNDGTAIPVNMVETADEVQKTINQGLLQYTFNLESAFQINTQRG